MRTSLKVCLALAVTGVLAIICLQCSLMGQKKKAKLPEDMRHLRQIGWACMMFADDHDGCYPGDWSQLAPLVDDPRVFLRENSDRRAGSLTNVMEWTDYAYVRGITTASPPNTVAAFVPMGQYKRPGTFVLFADSHVA